MSLSKSQLKTFKSALKIEKDGVIQFLKNIDSGAISISYMDLYDLQDESIEEKVKDLFKKLYRDGNSKEDLLYTLEEKKKEFRGEYDDDFLSDAEIHSDDSFGLDHINFEWSKQMIKEAKKEEDKLNKSKKLRAWEYGYKKAIEQGVDIGELDESIKSLISQHVKKIKSGKRIKTVKNKKKKKKKKKKK